MDVANPTASRIVDVRSGPASAGDGGSVVVVDAHDHAGATDGGRTGLARISATGTVGRSTWSTTEEGDDVDHSFALVEAALAAPMLRSLMVQTLSLSFLLAAHSSRNDLLQKLYTATVWWLVGRQTTQAYLRHLLLRQLIRLPLSGIPGMIDDGPKASVRRRSPIPGDHPSRSQRGILRQHQTGTVLRLSKTTVPTTG